VAIYVSCAALLASCSGGYQSASGAGAAQNSTVANPTPTPAPISNQAFSVSPSGSDFNNGLTAGSPFLTLTKAQSAMQASSTFKSVCLRAGRYNLSSTFDLTKTP
jgi:hypothetical protein